MVRLGWYTTETWRFSKGCSFTLDVKEDFRGFFATLISASSFEEKMEKISGHVKSSQSVALQRFQFRQQEQGPSETLTTFASARQELAEVCAFGCWQEKLILDQLMDRAADRQIWEKLFMGLDTLTVAQAVELGSHIERGLQKHCPGFISVLTKQWENCSSTSKIWKIRNYNCCNQWYCWRQRRPPALTAKYDQEKQNQFIPFCHSPMSFAPVMRRQQLGWPVRCPAASNTIPGRVRNIQVGCWWQRAWDGVTETRHRHLGPDPSNCGSGVHAEPQLSAKVQNSRLYCTTWTIKWKTFLSGMKVLHCYMLDFCSFSFARLKSCMKAFGEV